MDSLQTIILSIGAAVAIPVGSIVASLFLVGHISRWYKLQELYPEKTTFHGKWHQGVSMMINGMSFNRALDIGEGDEYMHVKPGALINYLLKPFQLPWTAVASVRVRKILWAEMVELTLNEPKITLCIRQGLLKLDQVPKQE